MKIYDLIIVALIGEVVLSQQCINSQHQRCLCISPFPYCPCASLTATNTLNFNSNYRSHLILSSGIGCRPCPADCLKCSSPTICTQCQLSFELVGSTCRGCPINCQKCANNVCSLCNEGYYLDYQLNCQTCPIAGTKVCTISSLISCQNNYWLDNNAANCIQCDPNCQQCSSTTRCSTCNQGSYLQSNFTCALCMNSCLTCSGSGSCILCKNNGFFFNSNSGMCQLGSVSGCISYGISGCSQCGNTSYLDATGQCVQIPNANLINLCQSYHMLANSSLICSNCSVGYFNSTTGCSFGCSVLCVSCYGPHYGLCFSCQPNSYLYNLHCLPQYNINGGAAFQLYYSAFNNPTWFQGGSIRSQDSCIFEDIYEGSSISFKLEGLKSYEVTLSWKVYIYSISSGNTSYTFTFNNTQHQIIHQISTNIFFNNCSSNVILAHKHSITISGVILTNNTVTLSHSNTTLGISELHIVSHRCGGIQGVQCQQCSSTSVCTKCVNPNYFVSGHTCVQSCPATYFVRVAYKTCLSSCPQGTFTNLISQQCIQCTSPCETCSSVFSCLTCLSGYYLYGIACLATCPSGYYPDQMRRTCQPCLRPCLSCLSNIKCLSCIYGFYQNTSNSCVLNCGPGFYGNLSSLNCQSCLSPCLTCNQYSGTQCLSCISGYIYFNQECILNCPSGYLQTSNSTLCQICDTTCLTCTNTVTNCSSCSPSTYLHNNVCTSSCPSSFFANSVLNTCQACPSNCSSCINQARCLSCANSSYLFSGNDSCLLACPEYFFGQNNKCLQCQLPCITCLSQSQCLSCSGLFLFNSSCIASCPSSTYEDATLMECIGCNSSNCLSCSLGPNLCTKCEGNLTLFESSCISGCPLGYYHVSSSNTCTICSQKCQACLNSSFCTICQSNYALLGGLCTKSCILGSYLITINNSLNCQLCPNNCASCTQNNGTLQCNSCSPGFFLSNNSCLNSCPSFTYFSSNQCFACQAPCSSCSSEMQCLGCLSSSGSFFNGSCLSTCPLGYFSNNLTNTCETCSSSCLNCEGASNNCVSCPSGFLLKVNHCLLTCGIGYYSTSSSKCEKCSSSCTSCSVAPYNCTACSSFLVLLNGQCLESCNIGFYRSKNSCLPCNSSCNHCLNESHCISCSFGFYLTSSSICVSVCPSTYYPFNGVCRKCSYPCSTCTDSRTCSSCLAGYAYQGSCLWSCPGSTFFNSTSSTCQNCPTNCSECTAFACTSCSSGVLVNGSCTSTCLTGFYVYYSVCAPCIYGCNICIDSTTCLNCSSGYLYQGLCLSSCPSGWVNVVNSSTCLQCVSGCQKCIVQPSQCIQCSSNLFLHTFSCLSLCPSGTYSDSTTRSCITCKAPCATCNNGYSCSSCIYGYILYTQPSGNQCILGPKCPNSFYLNTASNQCVQTCPLNLYVQPTTFVCSKPCEPIYVLFNSTCLSNCPSGMWIDSSKVCSTSQIPSTLPEMKCSTLILRNILILDCTFNVPISNLNTLKPSNLTLSGMHIIQIIVFSDIHFRAVTTQPSETFISNYLNLSFTYPYQLISKPQGRLLQNSSSTNLPVQNIQTTIFLKLYHSYSKNQRRTGLQLMQLSMSMCIGALIFWFLAALKNLKTTSLVFVAMLQWLHSISLVEMPYPPNLSQFLQGFRFSNLFFTTSPPNSNPIWNINNSYRQSLWGVVNYFDFEVSIMPSLAVFSFFGIFFVVTKFIHLKFGKEEIEDKKQKTQGSEQKEEPSLISNIPSRSHVVGQSLRQTESKMFDKKQERHETDEHLVKQELNQQVYKKKEEIQSSKQKQDTEWEETKNKISKKCKILNDRFYFNYCLQMTLLTASPLSIAINCQLISANPISLPFTLIITLIYIVIIILFLRYLTQSQKPFVSTKYWFVMFFETLILNSLAILATAQIYIGFSLLLFLINIYIWSKVFKSKRSTHIRKSCQLNQILRSVIMLQILIGFTNNKKWSPNIYYFYCWIIIVTAFFFIIAVAVQSIRLFFDSEEGTAPLTSRQNSLQEKEDKQSSVGGLTIKSSQPVQEQMEEKQPESAFFSQKEGEDQSDSQDDIIDFNQNQECGQEVPRQLYKVQKQKHN